MNINNEQVVIDTNAMFDAGYLCGKSLYMYCFKGVPSVNYIGQLDGENAFNTIRTAFDGLIKTVHSYRDYDRKLKGYDFSESYLVLKNNCVVEFGMSYCLIYHNGLQDDFVSSCTNLMVGLKEKQRRKPLEINLINSGRNGFELSQFEVKRTQLKLDLFYDDDFKEINSIICKRLGKDRDKGIVLLHGLPGTGKTTYLRYLIGKIKKRILFVSPSVAGDLMNPSFIQLLVSNPNSVLIIEDAENVIMDRKLSNNASVSNLLNISDGLLADFLNVQLICTFNSPLTLVDSALLRKGRLIAKYEFGKLSVEKSQRLSTYFGFDTAITRPMTIAEIANPAEKDQADEQVKVLGFRRDELMVS